MELHEALRTRRMTRAFTDASVEPPLLDDLLDQARRAPSAGNTQGTEYLVLDTPDLVDAYWSLTLPVEHRPAFPWPDLLRAPVLCIPLVDPTAYVRRYAEADKVRTGLGESADAWAVPYWFVDGGMVVQNLLLLAHAEGLGALFFGLFDNERVVLDHFEVPAHLRALGTVAIGHPAAQQRRSSSQHRQHKQLPQLVHRGAYAERHRTEQPD